MKIDRNKLELEKARACMGNGELAAAAKMSRNTLNSIIRRGHARACTLGKIAKALEVDPAEIIEEE